MGIGSNRGAARLAPIIVAKGLTKKYGDLVAVDHVDFAVEEGECFGFLGPNGAGKTTTMKMIFCVSPVTGGELCVASLDVRTSPRDIKSIVGVVPQDNNLDPDLTVLENLLVYARYFDIPKPVALGRALEYLELLQLLDKQHSRIDQLSGGMKRRLLVCRALINQPRLMILDEPTTGLDPQGRHLVWQKLRFLKEQGVTMVLTTHYMEEAAQLCDRLVIMDLGRILTCGAPEELVERHVGREVLELRLEPHDRAAAVRRLSELGLSVEEVENTVYVFGSDGAALRDLPARLGLHARGIAYRQASLEDVFLKLAGRGLRE
ncbi:MAG: ABC transporter ATP-binding protein [Chloroflexi bacterium]|nr:ABC transporter ATP-binding protein [Chloroflexota bacterium]